MRLKTAISMPVSMDEILARCVPDGDCMVWSGSMSADDRPLWHMRKRMVVPVRRLVLEMQLGRRLAKGKLAGCSCDTVGCVVHAKEVTRQELLAIAKAAGRIGGPACSARAARLARSRPTKLSMEAAQEIRRRRSEGETLVSLASEFGVHHSMIDRVCKGRAWAPIVGSSVFTLGGS